MTGKELFEMLVAEGKKLGLPNVSWSSQFKAAQETYSAVAAQLELAGTVHTQPSPGLAAFIQQGNQIAYQQMQAMGLSNAQLVRAPKPAAVIAPPTCRHCGAESKFAATDLAGLCWDCNEARR